MFTVKRKSEIKNQHYSLRNQKKKNKPNPKLTERRNSKDWSNDKQNREQKTNKVKKTKSWFSKEARKIDKTLAKLTNVEEEKA